MKIQVCFILLLSFCIVNPVSSQEVTTNNYRKNSIYGSFGIAGFYATLTGNYERIITQNLDRGITATFAKAGFGTYGAWGDSGQYSYLQYGFLTGRKGGHLEVSAGPNFVLKGNMDFPLAFTVGYRYQKPGKPFMIRLGIAFPESAYFGIGVSF